MGEAAERDQKIMALFLDFSYGGIVQGLYVACKLALAAGTNDQRLVTLFNEQAARVDKVRQALEAYAANPELDALVKRSQHEAVLKPVAEILKTNRGNLTEPDVVTILSWIEPERSKVVGKCK